MIKTKSPTRLLLSARTLLVGCLFFAMAAVSFPARVPAESSWSLGGRLVPGPLPPNPFGPTPALDEYLNVVYGRQGGQDILLDLAKPALCRDQKVPLVIFVHGGGWSAGDKSGALDTAYAKMFYQLGFAVASIDYRLAPEFHFPAQINDCKLSIRYLRAHAEEFGLDPERIGAWGASAGGHLVCLLGTAAAEDGLEGPGLEGVSSLVSAVVNHFGPTDLTVGFVAAASAVSDFLGCNPSDCPENARAASPVTYVTPGDSPILTIHGEDDSIVPYGQAVILAKKLREVGNACALIKVKNANHGFVPSSAGAVIQPSLERIVFLTVAHLARSLEPALLGDVNMDGRVDLIDVAEVWARLGQEGVGAEGLEAPDSWNPLADIILDGKIDYQDFMAEFGLIKY